MDWSASGWDATRDGQLQSCVYDSQDYANFACSDFAPFVSSETEGNNTAAIYMYAVCKKNCNPLR